MIRSKFLIFALPLILLIIFPRSLSADIVLVSEQFDGGFNSQPGVVWTTNDTGFETYAAGGAGVRDMNSDYDHDQDSGTPNVTIPGAIELNADGADSDLFVTFILDERTDTNEFGLLEFFAGLRITDNGDAPTLFIENLTDSRTIMAETNVGINATNNDIWEFNSYNISLLSTDLGDQIQIRLTGGGSGSANGLEMADFSFSVQSIPEPGTAAILVAGFCLAFCKRRRSV